jgi:hypothetical protein
MPLTNPILLNNFKRVIDPNENYLINEDSTTSWSKMMKGVNSGESGPWSLIAIDNKKVVGQEINIKIKDILPAQFEEMRRKFPKASIHIEDSTGKVVWKNK